MDKKVNFILYCSEDYKDTLNEILNGIGFSSVESIEEAKIIIMEPPFPIQEPALSKVFSGEKKLLFLIPDDVLKEIEEGKELESSYSIVKPEAILNFVSFIRKALENEI